MKGKVVTCEKVKIPTLQTAVVKGLTMVTGHQKNVHVLVEPSPKGTSVFVLENTSGLKPWGTRCNSSTLSVLFIRMRHYPRTTH